MQLQTFICTCTHTYVGATPIDLKVLFDPADGALLGAQAVGAEGAERRVDVVAALMQKRGTVYDLEELELCYGEGRGGGLCLFALRSCCVAGCVVVCVPRSPAKPDVCQRAARPAPAPPRAATRLSPLTRQTYIQRRSSAAPKGR